MARELQETPRPAVGRGGVVGWGERPGGVASKGQTEEGGPENQDGDIQSEQATDALKEGLVRSVEAQMGSRVGLGRGLQEARGQHTPQTQPC